MGELVWDERLISQEEFWALAGRQPLRPGIRRGLLFADCGDCGQAVLPLGTARSPFPLTCEQLAGAVLRHRVSAHDMPLNHRRNGGDQRGAAGGGPGVDAAADRGGGVPGRGRADAAGRRPAAETAGGRREPGAAGGDRP